MSSQGRLLDTVGLKPILEQRRRKRCGKEEKLQGDNLKESAEVTK